MLAEFFFETVPANEPCAQAGHDEDYWSRARAEAHVMKRYLMRLFGEIPGTAEIRIIQADHDTPYLELRGRCNDEDEESMAWLCQVEDEWPAEWDETARQELAQAGYPVSPPPDPRLETMNTLLRKIDNDIESAKEVLRHYLRRAWQMAGGEWDNDNTAEVNLIVDNIFDAVRNECALRQLKAEVEHDAA